MNNQIKIGNRLDRHDVSELMIAGFDAYAVAYCNCSTKTDHAATHGARESVSKITGAKLLNKTLHFAFFGVAKDGTCDKSANYVRVIALGELDHSDASKADVYSRKVGLVSVRGSLALLKARCKLTNTSVVTLGEKDARALAEKLAADKGLAKVWQSVGINRAGKSRALALDDFAIAGLVEDVRNK